jgi:hypothetical protein
MKEKDFYPDFREHNKEQGVFELKLCKETRFAFNRLDKHQMEALLKANSNDIFNYHINDAPFSMKFTTKKPFDFIGFKQCPAYLVLIWWIPFKKKDFHYIKIQAFINEVKISKRKSLTEQRSKEIAMLIISL